MANRNLRDLSDYARAKVGVRVECLHCGKTAVLDPWRLMMALMAAGRPYWMSEVKPRLRCKACGSRRAKVIPHLGRD